MNKELYVSSTPHETKVALLEDDELSEVYFERENEYTLAGSIYKGRVTRVLPGMQSAFVDIGLERDAFLYVSDFLELEEEDDDLGPVQLQPHLIDPNKPAAQLSAPVAVEGEAEEFDEAEDEGGEEPEASTAGEGAQQDDSASRRWKGRRRRRGRRGGRERTENTPAEASAEKTAEAPALEPIEEDLPEEESFAEAAPAPKAPPVERILLPGESIARYQNRGAESAPEPTESASEERPERDFRRDRGDRDRGGRGGGRFGRGGGRRDRYEGRDRSEGRERGEEPTALPSNYQPIVLPGESISKYRNQPAAVASTEVEAHAEEALGSANTSVQDSTQEETFHATSSSAQEPAFTAPEKSEERFENMNVASIFGGDAVDEPSEQFEAEGKSVSEVAHTTAVESPAPPSELSQPSAVQTEESREVPEWNQTDRHDDRSAVLADVGEAPALQSRTYADDPVQPSEEATDESAFQSEQEQPEHHAGSYVLEGGQVEHEEIDEEETDLATYEEELDHYHAHDFEEETLDAQGGRISGEVVGDAVRESEEEAVLEEEEYEFNGDGEAGSGDEFEESELMAGAGDEEEPEDGHAELRAPAGTASYQRTERTERPGYDKRGGGDRNRDRGRRGGPRRNNVRPRRDFRPAPAIADLLKEGQEVLIQIAKEPIGKKGARITSHIALPGRFLVYMPTVNHIGVSRKINSDEERMRLKRIVASERENGHGGFIVRTAASNVKEDELRADIRFLKHLWTEIRTRAENSKSPALIYHDLNLVERVLRDQVTSDFSQIWVDSQEEYERAIRFASRFQPSLLKRIKLYTKTVPLFEQFGIQEEINKSLKSKVWLKSGGYIVINQTEALVAIDINTGKYVGKTARLEDTIVKTNCDAIKEIVRQVRLRDLGGIIVIDFIDMDERKNRQKVMQTLEEALKADRAPSKVLQFNDFGLVAITRKRVKQSLERTLGTPCPYCVATGFVKSPVTVANEIFVEMKKVRTQVEKDDVILRVNPEVAKELKTNNGKRLQELEELVGRTVLIKSDAQLHQEQFDINF
jgi:Rne/Rng family ribonuclease